MKRVCVKLSKWLSLLMAAMLAFSSLGFMACSDGGDNGTEQVKAASITLSVWNDTVQLGDTMRFAPEFANFETNPTSVDVYIEGVSDAIKTGVTLKDGEFSIETGQYDTGTYKIHVKAGGVESNHLSVTLTSEIDAPTNVSVAESTSKANTVTVSWNAVENNEVTYYWIYYGKTNDTYSFTKPNAVAYAGVYFKNGAGSYDITLSESGSYYFWVKATNGNAILTATKCSGFSSAKSYAFTYASLTAPTNVSVSLSSEKANTATVTWTASDAAYYWIYASTTNDTTSLTRPNASAHAGIYVNNGTGSYDIVLEENGPWYFWVKAADAIYSSSVNSSDFSTVETFSFTYKELTPPTNVTATASGSSGKVKVTWTASDAAYYWIYASTTNDTTSLTHPNASAHAGIYVTDGAGSYDISLSESGTYYIWVKAANAIYSSSGKSSAFSTAATYTVN